MTDLEKMNKIPAKRGILIAAVLCLSAAALLFAIFVGKRKEKERLPEESVLTETAETVSEELLPSRFDLREQISFAASEGQGGFSTCWAFAAVKALETSLPEEIRVPLSPDHMILRNGISHDPDEGGEASMAMAYLLSGTGPVTEEEDPYGDRISPDGLMPVCLVHEIRLPAPDDRDGIKKAVFETGGVQSSLYLPQRETEEWAQCYDEQTFSFCYQGTEKQNHDIVIIGWDDDYPAENFRNRPSRDGAYLCMNSWGCEFGDEGCFYVSYEDSGIGIYNVSYSGVSVPDGKLKLYQTDLCGFTGQLGYGSSHAWFANIYEAEEDCVLKAAGFYATKINTSYHVYTASQIPLPGDTDIVSKALVKRHEMAQGTLQDTGYYTIGFDRELPVRKGERFAVLVEIDTPDTTEPVAIEYPDGGRRNHVDITDGEGYISFDGHHFDRTEDSESCNVCLKVYAQEK